MAACKIVAGTAEKEHHFLSRFGVTGFSIHAGWSSNRLPRVTRTKETTMAERAMGIDEAISKIGAFSRADAIDLIASSQGILSWTGKLGHPLEHCETTFNRWPRGRFHNLSSALGSNDGGAVEALRDPADIAAQLGKGSHTLSWTDEHLILAVRDLFLGKGAFMALHNLKKAGVPARLEFQKPTSHSTSTMTATSMKLPANGGRMVGTATTAISCAYKAILDLCAPDRLHLQTIYAQQDNSPNVRIVVTKRVGGQTSTAFQTEFSAF